MKRSDELLNNLSDEIREKTKKFAKDLASYKNKPIEEVYRDIIFPSIYHHKTKDDLEKLGIK